jgi:uncharacterized protein YndB with AHSA1/START domain
MDNLLKRTDQELIITRDLKAPREKVFAAWTDPGQAAQWWCPSDCTLLSCELDVRTGGKWHRSLRVPNGSVITKYGVYREVEVPSRLVFTYATDYGDGTVDPETVVSLTFAETPGGTRFTLWHTGFEDVALRDSHIGGWVRTMDKLQALCGEGQ